MNIIESSPRIIWNFFAVVCISFFCLFLFFLQPTQAQSLPEDARQITTRIVPDVLDGHVVYPTNHATIAIDPLHAYRWVSVDVPEEWTDAGYLFEIWDSRNAIVPGFGSVPLEESTIDLYHIDPTLYPQIRLIIFRPEVREELPYAEPVFFTYTEQFNTRLCVFAGLMMLIYGALLFAVFRYRLGVREFFLQTRALLRRENMRASSRQMFTYALLTVGWSAVFAVVLGVFTGGVQIVYLFIKLPFLFLGAFCFTIFSNLTLTTLLGVRASPRELATQSLSVIATSALALAACSPIILFYISIPQNHDELLISTIFFFAAASTLGAFRFFEWIREQTIPISPLLVTAVWIGIYGIVLLQLGWLLRPWVGTIDPVQHTLPFFRLYSGNVFEAVMDTLMRI